MLSTLLVSCWKEHLGAPGMALLDFDEECGALRHLDTQFPELSCNCTAFDRERQILYITNELHENPDYPKGGGGLVWAFRYDAQSRCFTPLSRVESSCPCPAYLSLDRTKRYLVCANHSSFNAVTRAVKGPDGFWHTEVIYDDAFVGLFRLKEDGAIGELVDVKKHSAYPAPPHTLHAHPHTALMSPDGKFFACCDKGDSHIYFYTLDYEKEELRLCGEPFHDCEGASPRYCAFHPTEKLFFVNHERDMRVTAFRYDEGGNLTKLGSAFALPEELLGLPTPAVREALHGESALPPADGLWPLEQQGFCLSADGRFLYDMLNGADAVAVFAVEKETGALTRLQTVPVEGRWVRGGALSPDGRFLVVSALQSGGVSVFPIRPDGTLGACVSRVELRGGSYLTFLQGRDKS